MVSGGSSVPAKMKCYSLHGGGKMKSLCCVPSLVSLLVVTWLLVVTADAAVLLEGDPNETIVSLVNPLELQPPDGRTGEYFGFSLAHYINNNERWLLVGAPKSSISDPNAIHSGGLYQCPLSDSTGDHKCHEVPVDLTYGALDTGTFTSNNSVQGLGFSLASSDEEIVVCAPRWYATRIVYRRIYVPAGMCFAAKSPSYKFEAFSLPFEVDSTQQISYVTTGSCQFGMSAAYVKDQNKFALGAPGCWGWQGATWEFERGTRSSRLVYPLESEDLRLGDDGWELFNLYLGYSVASLKFGDDTAILSSIPKTTWSGDTNAVNTFGPTILILAHDPKNGTALSVKQKISPSEGTAGEVLFSYFGYSLATLDVNGDKLEDLVVGAPLYQPPTGPNRKAATGYEYGAIYVYIQTVSENHENNEKVYEMKEERNAPQRIGTVPYSRFGSCVASVGDLDGDGYEDLAVGAPFRAGHTEEGTETGAVYIYMGSSTGLENKAHQIIGAAPNQRGFGSSIGQQLQTVEGRGYDVAVGIYDSDKVLVFKSKEVVKVDLNLTFDKPIDLTENSCYCAQYQAQCPCVNAVACLRYQRKFNKFQGHERLDFNITLSTDKRNKLSFENEKTEIKENISVKEGEESCIKKVVMAEPGKDEITAYDFTAQLSLAKEEQNVILDRHSDLIKVEQLKVRIHCESADVSGCQSNINLHYDVLEPYTYDSKPMKIKFKVNNHGETAYDSRLIIRSDDVFDVMGLDLSDTVVCKKTINMEIECKMGNIGNNSEANFTLRLAPSKQSLDPLSVAEHAHVFNMTAEVETVSSISNPDTAVKNIQVNINVNGSLNLLSIAKEPNIVYYNSSSYYKSPEDAKDEEQLGPEIKHIYSIINRNAFSIPGADLRIHWPQFISGKHFLYLTKEPEFSGMNPSCQYSNGELDPLSLASKSGRVIRSLENQIKGPISSPLIMDSTPDYMTITCHFGVFSGGYNEVTIELTSRLVMRTLDELAVGTAVRNASSYVDLQITKMPFSVVPPEVPSSALATEISYKDFVPETKVPVWLYIVAVLGGILVLGIIVVIMWKCGFFKRKRMANAERTALCKEEEEKEREDERANMTEEKEEVATPLSPMLEETEVATDDFQFQKTL